MNHGIGLLGILTFVTLAWLFSANRRRFPWRAAASGIVLQLLLGWCILRTDTGRWFFGRLDAAFNRLLGFSQEGVSMVFGPLANSQLLMDAWGKNNAFLFVVTVTGTIVLVSALSSLLYHYGVLQLIVRGVAWVMRRVMGTSGSETLAAAANIFMGQTEAPLVIKPYLPTMTRSELMALMVGGMATIAGGVLAAYVQFGISAGHLLTASVISAPASLMFAKILLPETEVSDTADGSTREIPRETVNGLDAVCVGASDGIKLSMNVMAMLIAFVALVALANYLLSWSLAWAGYMDPKPMQTALGWVNAPFAWLMGIPWQDCKAIGSILGERIVINEFMGYLSLSKVQGVQPGSIVIATYALCGFANFSSIAIQIGGIGALAETRRADLAKIGFKAMIGGLLSCYCTACIAGLLVK